MKKIQALANEKTAQSVAGFMKYICYLLILFFGVGIILSFMGRQTFVLHTADETYDYAIYAEKDHNFDGTRGPTVGLTDSIHVIADDKVDLITQVGISGMYLVNMLPLLLSFWFLAKVFNNVSQGQIFIGQNANYLLYYGLLQILTAVIVPFVKLLICAGINLLTANELSVGTGQNMINDVIPGIAFIVAAYIIRYGVHLQDEVDHTL